VQPLVVLNFRKRVLFAVNQPNSFGAGRLAFDRQESDSGTGHKSSRGATRENRRDARIVAGCFDFGNGSLIARLDDDICAPAVTLLSASFIHE
jgi:hypothetical protein